MAAKIGPGERSFNLGESELTFAASVDPYFSAQLTAAITGEDEIEVEEAFFRTLALPAGFVAKGGRFFSGFGYLNEVHAHAWDFADQPLVYQAFFGNQRAQDGLQLKWIAPTDLFIELGAETGNGDAFPGTRRGGNGLNGATLFAHVGGDLGDTANWRAGAAWIDLEAEGREYEDIDGLGEPVLNAFTGSSRNLGGGCRIQMGARRRFGAPVPQAPGRVSPPRGIRRPDVRSGKFRAYGCLPQHAIRLVPAGRLPVPSALARGLALRLAGFGQSTRSGSSRAARCPRIVPVTAARRIRRARP